MRFATAPHLVHELIEARDEKRLLRLQAQLARVNLLIVDELGYVPLSQTGSELLFDVFSRRYENGATIVTSNLPFQEWTTVFASERLTGALLDRITHHVHILEMNGRQLPAQAEPGTTPATVRITPRLAAWAHRPLYGRLPVARADSVLRVNQVAVLYPACSCRLVPAGPDGISRSAPHSPTGLLALGPVQAWRIAV